jgi:hypothetical protein
VPKPPVYHLYHFLECLQTTSYHIPTDYEMVQDSQANGAPLIAFFRKKFSEASSQIVAKCSTNSKGRTQAAQRARIFAPRLPAKVSGQLPVRGACRRPNTGSTAG